MNPPTSASSAGQSPPARVLSMKRTKDWADIIDVAIETEDWSLVEELRDKIHDEHAEAWVAAPGVDTAAPTDDATTAVVEAAVALCVDWDANRSTSGQALRAAVAALADGPS